MAEIYDATQPEAVILEQVFETAEGSGKFVIAVEKPGKIGNRAEHCRPLEAPSDGFLEYRVLGVEEVTGQRKGETECE